MLQKRGLINYYQSKDGNIYNNPWDAKAANTRYEQQQNILSELKRANDLKSIELQNAENHCRESQTSKIKEIQYNRALEQLEQLNIDLNKLNKLNKLIMRGDPLLIKQLDILETEEIFPRNKIKTSLIPNILLRKAIKGIGDIAIITGLIVSIMNNIAYMSLGLIFSLIIYNILVNIRYKYTERKIIAEVESELGRPLREEADVFEEESKLKDLIEKSKQDYEKDFQDFRYKNFDRETEELFLQLDYLKFKPLDMTQIIEDTSVKQPYYEYINNIK